MLLAILILCAMAIALRPHESLALAKGVAISTGQFAVAFIASVLVIAAYSLIFVLILNGLWPR